jgi:lipoprotein-releasing system permease protein
MKAQLLLSWRYLLCGRKEKFVSLISVISILGIAIGVMALIVVIAVMTGFDRDLHDKIVGNQAHLTISGFQAMGETELEAVSAKVSGRKGVLGISPYLQGQVLVKEGEKFFAVGLKGVDPLREAKVTRIKQYLISGDINGLGENGIVIGKELAA